MTKRKWMLIAFIAALIPKLIISLTLYPYNIYDEFGSMASAAYVAGYDWSNLLKSEGGYYGFGYYIFYAPIFMITSNPYIIYKVIVCGNSIIQASCSVIAYEILNRIFVSIEHKEKVLFSVMLSYLINAITNAMNETPATLVVWVSALMCVLIIQTSGWKKNLCNFILIFDLAWGLTIHTRLILIFGVVICFSILYKLIWKEWFLYPIHYLVLIILYFISKAIVHLVQQKLWFADSADSLGNATINMSFYISRFNFMDVSTWKLFFEIFIGQIGTVTIFSAGLFVAGILIIFSYVLKVIKRKELNMPKNKMILLLAGINGICIFATIAGQMLTWGYQTLTAINNNEVEAEIYKVFTYIRYFAIYMGPLILCSIGIMRTDNRMLRAEIPYIVIFIAAIECIWINEILPHVKVTNMAGEEFGLFANRQYAERVNYIYAFVWLNIYLIIFIFCAYSNKLKWYICAVCLMLIANFAYKVNESNVYSIVKSHEATYCYKFVREIESNIDTNEMNIYADGFDDLRLQFYLNRYPIYHVEQLNVNSENLIFCKGTLDKELIEKLLNEDYCWYYAELGEDISVLVCENIADEIIEITDYLLMKLDEVYLDI